MAVRKKAETIHLRVSSTSKSCLEGLANAMDKTSTLLIEEWIAQAAEAHPVLEVDMSIDKRYWSDDGWWTISKAIALIQQSEEPVLRMLRAYFVAAETLSKKDKLIAGAIMANPERFSGETDIFLESEKVITNPEPGRMLKIDLHKVNEEMSSLEMYADFSLKNKALRSNYKNYLKMAAP
ncbi:hypothetical protein [Pseudomonas helleri]|uniref:hypothetical protein n=1 Tax=Pseudomonas helleri TaxID=1608996 RepID=UPI003F9E0D5C